ncbi:twin-arginine translocation signal domain-containing protein [Halomonas sp. GFAJ-1]|uniref:twin-arginine translocation signal domain-containing protein n=1 Tax=Halomonas sp. GFAJ-1 TaxID=1118153 RepID=UPI00023A4BD1|nr:MULTISPECIES: twin-arginine translocation signal domain-containing protein [unclassified Halomonas]AVI62283.1 twin-arginine translocation pathway signal [Halomonas sp. GFAJ-1]EHK59678.1 twin-arginine translocation pathway signal [Halomonas sp. GFAJ-1]MDP3534536.1 twin-arginine translocation signal domain-containing protein [Halomonas sp.]
MQTSHNSERRRFIKTVGLGTAAAGAAAAVGHVTLAQADNNKPVESEKASVNYRETDHVRAYYASLRD